MAETSRSQPSKTKVQQTGNEALKKPIQVLHISRRDEKESLNQAIDPQNQSKDGKSSTEDKTLASHLSQSSKSFEEKGDSSNFEGLSMADLLGPASLKKQSGLTDPNKQEGQEWLPTEARVVDDFDFDEEAFLAALDENEPVGNTGEIAKGSVISVESDGIYVDIGGKAPGFMPKNECALGVITNLKERFPKGLKVEVLVTRDQNADGIVTISCRALALRKSWENIKDKEKEGAVIKVKVNGFNRGGVTCDYEGIRGFIPRSQLEDGQNHETLVGKTINVAFLEVNPDRRKLVLSEKRAATAARFAQLEVGQLIEGKVTAIKPYGFFVDLGGLSGLLHHSMITNGNIRSLREVFKVGDELKALITQMDPKRGRIGLNTALLEGPPGEIITDKDKVMGEAFERAEKARKSILKPDEQASNPEQASKT